MTPERERMQRFIDECRRLEATRRVLELADALDAAESRAARAEEQRDRLAEALRDVTKDCQTNNGYEGWCFFCGQTCYGGVEEHDPKGCAFLRARAALAEADKGVVGGGG